MTSGEHAGLSLTLISKINNLCQAFSVMGNGIVTLGTRLSTMVESTRYCFYHFVNLVTPKEIYLKYQHHEAPKEIFPSVVLFSNHLDSLTFVEEPPSTILTFAH